MLNVLIINRHSASDYHTQEKRQFTDLVYMIRGRKLVKRLTTTGIFLQKLLFNDKLFPTSTCYIQTRKLRLILGNKNKPATSNNIVPGLLTCEICFILVTVPRISTELLS